MAKETKKLGSGEKRPKEAKPVDPKPKTEKDRVYAVEVSVKVKLDKDCGLPEAARMVLERHASHLLLGLLGSDPKGSSADAYLIATPKAIRVKKWELLDLRPAKATDDKQEELPTNEKE